MLQDINMIYYISSRLFALIYLTGLWETDGQTLLPFFVCFKVFPSAIPPSSSSSPPPLSLSQPEFQRPRAVETRVGHLCFFRYLDPEDSDRGQWSCCPPLTAPPPFSLQLFCLLRSLPCSFWRKVDLFWLTINYVLPSLLVHIS